MLWTNHVYGIKKCWALFSLKVYFPAKSAHFSKEFIFQVLKSAQMCSKVPNVPSPVNYQIAGGRWEPMRGLELIIWPEGQWEAYKNCTRWCTTTDGRTDGQTWRTDRNKKERKKIIVFNAVSWILMYRSPDIPVSIETVKNNYVFFLSRSFSNADQQSPIIRMIYIEWRDSIH